MHYDKNTPIRRPMRISFLIRTVPSAQESHLLMLSLVGYTTGNGLSPFPKDIQMELHGVAKGDSVKEKSL